MSEIEDLRQEFFDALETCPSNPTHIMMNPDKYHQLKGAYSLDYVFKALMDKDVPAKISGLTIILCDAIDGIYCGKVPK